MPQLESLSEENEPLPLNEVSYHKTQAKIGWIWILAMALGVLAFTASIILIFKKHSDDRIKELEFKIRARDLRLHIQQDKTKKIKNGLEKKNSKLNNEVMKNKSKIEQLENSNKNLNDILSEKTQQLGHAQQEYQKLNNQTVLIIAEKIVEVRNLKSENEQLKKSNCKATENHNKENKQVDQNNQVGEGVS